MTTIVMCADHDPRGPIDVPGVDVIEATDLCGRVGQLDGLVPAGETSLLLALHGSEYHAGRVQAALRRLGVDPLGVGVLDLDRMDGIGTLSIAVAALAARTDAFPGSRPEQVKLVLPQTRTTRRSLFSLGVPTYTGAPMIDGSRCVAGDGCRACVRACPAEALTWGGGTIDYDKSACIACGVCVTTCPTGAVVNPVVTPGAVEAEIRAAIEASSAPIGIRYVCSAGRAAPMPGWYDVVVPCTGMVTVGWLLAPLLFGAGAVDAMACDASGCDRGLAGRVAAMRGDATVVLAAIGLEPTLVGGAPGDSSRLASERPPPGLLDAGCTQRVIAALSDTSTTRPGFVALDVADVGAILIDGETCTACEMCATSCPTDALRSASPNDEVLIDFDPGDCVACGQCITVCPEIDRGAIRLDRGFDVEQWRMGRRVVRREATARCEVCGKPVAPTAMLQRISTLLGDEHAGTLDVIATRCIDCRGR